MKTQRLTVRLLDTVLRLYQRITASRPSPCRFTPTCSQYSREAIAAHGAGRGLLLTARRLLRCHPWGGQGHDPVPARRGRSVERSTSEVGVTHV